MRHRARFTIILLLALTCTGCGWMKPTIVIHPDADLFITGTSWGQLEVSAYDSAQKVLVPVGTISPSDCKGRTLSKYNWEEYIMDQKKAAE
jgi:hypothetical protein